MKLCVLFLLLVAGIDGLVAHEQQAEQVHAQGEAAQTKDMAALRARVEASPRLPFTGVPFVAQPPATDWHMGAVSGVAVDAQGLIYEIQRGEQADPIVVLNCEGKVLRSWGKGDFTLPHSIRIGPVGDVWAVDAASSQVIEYSPLGRKLMTISVGGQPDTGSAFNGTTDVAFGRDGHVFITDGYGNARVLEYAGDGSKIREWGKPGAGPGELHLPHAIQIDPHGTIYVADRENGRIEVFDSKGKYLRAIAGLGRIYSMKLAGDVLWASMEPFGEEPGAGGGWIVKLDRRSGRILGHLDVPATRAGHGLEVMPNGEPIITEGNELLWFTAR